MLQRTSFKRAVVFFSTVGWICSTSVVGADGPAPANESPATPAFEFQSVPMPVPTPSASASEPAPAAEIGGEALPDGQSVKVNSLEMIDLHVKDLDITMVLQLLSIEAKRNIIATRNVSGSVSADLYGVNFYDALDAILHANGYGYEERNNFIYVYTADELEQRRQTMQKPVTRIVRLNYISAEDASAFVQPLLSGTGSIAVSGAVTAGFQPSVSRGGENSNAQGETMVIRDFAENVDEIVSVISQLDIRPKQVQVAATILEARLTENNAFGVDISAIIDMDYADFASPVGVVDNLIGGTGPALGTEQGQAVQTTVGQTGTGASGIKLGFLSNNINVFVKALDSVTDTTVIARPTLLALNRQSAELLVGERLGYLSTTATETAATQTVEFLEVGTSLKFRAFISDDDFVRLELQPSISDGTTVFEENYVIPNETTNSMITNVMVRSGQTVVLGGLFKEDTKVSRRQVPVLGDIPLAGWGFRGQDDDVTRSEVIFLITPTVVKDETLYAQGERINESTELARLGAKQALLPWSRTKQTSSYMNRAVEYYESGNRDKALWNVNMALTLDPTFVEALRLKAELTGEQLYMPDRSLINDAVNNIVNEKLPAKPVTQPTAAVSTEEPVATDDNTADTDPVVWEDPAGTQDEPFDGPSVSEVLNASHPTNQTDR